MNRAGKTRLAVVVGALAVAIVGLGYYSKRANDDARARVQASCATIVAHEEGQAESMRAAMEEFFDSRDKPVMTAMIAEWQSRLPRQCAQLEAELSGFNWNFGRRWEPPPEPAFASFDDARAAFERMRPRCEAAMRDLVEHLGAKNDSEALAEAMGACDLERIRAKAAIDWKSDREDWPPTLLDGWPRRLEERARGLRTRARVP